MKRFVIEFIVDEQAAQMAKENIEQDALWSGCDILATACTKWKTKIEEVEDKL